MQSCAIQDCMENVDWWRIRSFLAVAETGSLSAAARALNLSQPTLGRHIAELESGLNLILFTRTARGLVQTAAAKALVPHAMAMRDAAAKMSLVAAGHDETMSGTVRLTASRVVANYILPAMLAQFRQMEPNIQIELVPSDSSENLLFREADIAVRMYRPTQLNVITSHVCDLPMGLYATPAYISQHGTPQNFDDLGAHEFVGFDRSDAIISIMRNMGLTRVREDFNLRCDDQIVYWSLVRAGCGIGGMQTVIADAEPGVVRVAQFITLPALPIWLTAAEELRQTPRIRRVFDHLSHSFKALRLDPLAAIG